MYRNALMVVLAIYIAACASTKNFTCMREEYLVIHEYLYFGAAKPNGAVSQGKWDEFLRDTVTPLFPQGFTAWQAMGQWRTADGSLIRELSYVLSVVHPNDKYSDNAVLEIVGSYKSKFQQEAVLRIRSHACASF